MHERAYTLAGVIALGMALVASACSPHSPAPAPTPSATSSATTEPARQDGARPPLSPDVPEPGTEVTTTDQAQQARAAGAGIYVSTSGTQIVVHPTGPLPPAVIADLRAALSVLHQAPDTDELASAHASALAGASDALAGAGRQGILIVPAFETAPDKTRTQVTVIVTEAPAFTSTPNLRHLTPAGARAAVAATTTAHPDPTYALIDLTQP